MEGVKGIVLFEMCFSLLHASVLSNAAIAISYQLISVCMENHVALSLPKSTFAVFTKGGFSIPASCCVVLQNTFQKHWQNSQN